MDFATGITGLRVNGSLKGLSRKWYKAENRTFLFALRGRTKHGKVPGMDYQIIKSLLNKPTPGVEDYTKHFYSLLEAFSDKRYIEVNGKKLVFVFRPMEIPNPKQFIEIWQELAIKEGLKGFHFVGMHMPFDWQPSKYGFDGSVPGFFARDNYKVEKSNKQNSLFEKLKHGFKSNEIKKMPLLASYEKYVDRYPEQALN